MTKKQTQASFEDQLEQLESIVEAMEQGELPLEESLKQFEQGVKLTKSCQQMLEQARQRIKVLTEDEKLSDFKIAEDDAEYDSQA